MGLLDRVNAETRAIGGVPWRPWDDPYWKFNIGGPVHPSRSGVSGVDGALKLAPVYSSVRILAEGVAMLPWDQYRDLGDRKRKMPLGPLLSKPSAFINSFDWKFQYVSSAALQGTAWGLITGRDGYGFPTGVEWLPPEDMSVEDAHPFNPARTRFFYAGRPVSREDLLIIPAFTIPGRTAGISPLRYFQMLIESGHAALEYGNGWYESGGVPPGTFQNTSYEVEAEQANEIRSRLVSAQRRHEPLVYGRDWTYTPITIPPNEAQFIEALQLNATTIAGIYGVPPNRVGGVRGDSMTYSNVESESIGLIADTLDPWLCRLEVALEGCLPGSQFMTFNRSARLRTTIEQRFGAYASARNIGLYNVDELREMENLEPLPKPKGKGDYDGTDYTPLQLMVAAARGAKELLGEGVSGDFEAAPQSGPAAPAPKGGLLGQLQPHPVPAASGNGNGNGSSARS
jgi:HK97 family phage portal protein